MIGHQTTPGMKSCSTDGLKIAKPDSPIDAEAVYKPWNLALCGKLGMLQSNSCLVIRAMMPNHVYYTAVRARSDIVHGCFRFAPSC